MTRKKTKEERRESVDAFPLMAEASNRRVNRVIHFELEEILIDFVLQLIERVDGEFALVVRSNDTSVDWAIRAFPLPRTLSPRQSIDTTANANASNARRRTNRVESAHRFAAVRSNRCEPFEYFRSSTATSTVEEERAVERPDVSFVPATTLFVLVSIGKTPDLFQSINATGENSRNTIDAHRRPLTGRIQLLNFDGILNVTFDVSPRLHQSLDQRFRGGNAARNRRRSSLRDRHGHGVVQTFLQKRIGDLKSKFAALFGVEGENLPFRVVRRRDESSVQLRIDERIMTNQRFVGIRRDVSNFFQREFDGDLIVFLVEQRPSIGETFVDTFAIDLADTRHAVDLIDAGTFDRQGTGVIESDVQRTGNFAASADDRHGVIDFRTGKQTEKINIRHADRPERFVESLLVERVARPEVNRPILAATLHGELEEICAFVHFQIVFGDLQKRMKTQRTVREPLQTGVKLKIRFFQIGEKFLIATKINGRFALIIIQR